MNKKHKINVQPKLVYFWFETIVSSHGFLTGQVGVFIRGLFQERDCSPPKANIFKKAFFNCITIFYGAP